MAKQCDRCKRAREKERKNKRQRRKERKRNNQFAIVITDVIPRRSEKPFLLLPLSHHSTTLTFDLLPPPASLRVGIYVYTRTCGWYDERIALLYEVFHKFHRSGDELRRRARLDLLAKWIFRSDDISDSTLGHNDGIARRKASSTYSREERSRLSTPTCFSSFVSWLTL